MENSPSDHPKQRIHPKIQGAALAFALLQFLLLMAHLEWWSPSTGRMLNLPLVAYLLVTGVAAGCLFDPDDPYWNSDDEDL